MLSRKSRVVCSGTAEKTGCFFFFCWGRPLPRGLPFISSCISANPSPLSCVEGDCNILIACAVKDWFILRCCQLLLASDLLYSSKGILNMCANLQLRAEYQLDFALRIDYKCRASGNETKERCGHAICLRDLALWKVSETIL